MKPEWGGLEAEIANGFKHPSMIELDPEPIIGKAGIELVKTRNAQKANRPPLCGEAGFVILA